MKRALSRGVAFAALAIGVSTFGTEAFAKPGFAVVTLSPAQFVSNCQSLGGTSSAAPGGGVRCTLSSGQTVDCSFDTQTGQALCQWTKDLPPKSKKPLMGDPLPTTINPSTGKPKFPTTDAAPSTVN
jgi:hypothetical protein